MFETNKYTRIYFEIISRAQHREITGYYETHHIVPKSLGGSNYNNNLVKLTAREHFICHLLLIKMVSKDAKHKMVYAAWQQSRPRNYTGLKVTNRTYEFLKKQMSESYKGRKRKPFTDEARANMKTAAATRKKVPITEERLKNIRLGVLKREKLIGTKNPFYGKTHSKETKEKIQEVNSRVYTCPHCGKEGASNSMKRWHFNNCKIISLTHKDDSTSQY